jgi:hypothetical protein
MWGGVCLVSVAGIAMRDTSGAGRDITGRVPRCAADSRLRNNERGLKLALGGF